jgi:hypothetical protein
MTNPTDNQVLSPSGLLPSYGNEETVEEVLAKRQKTGGRQVGTPNKQKKFELMKSAQLYGLRALATIVEVMEDEDNPPTVRLSAATELLDRGFGKSKQMVEHGGIDGDEIKSRLIIEFVGQLPASHSTTHNSTQTATAQPADIVASEHSPNHSAALHSGPRQETPLLSPFKNAQQGRVKAPVQDVTDAIHKTVTVPVFKNPWES